MPFSASRPLSRVFASKHAPGRTNANQNGPACKASTYKHPRLSLRALCYLESTQSTETSHEQQRRNDTEIDIWEYIGGIEGIREPPLRAHLCPPIRKPPCRYSSRVATQNAQWVWITVTCSSGAWQGSAGMRRSMGSRVERCKWKEVTQTHPESRTSLRNNSTTALRTWLLRARNVHGAQWHAAACSCSEIQNRMTNGGRSWSSS